MSDYDKVAIICLLWGFALGATCPFLEYKPRVQAGFAAAILATLLIAAFVFSGGEP